jgi:hypothetical protein
MSNARPEAHGMTNTFIRMAEVWMPDAGRRLLDLGGGLYGHARRFGALGRSMCFDRGEGLPDEAWYF